MTQEQINEDCRNYIEWIRDIAINRKVDFDMADHFGLDVNFSYDDYLLLKQGYELFYEADENTPGFETLIRQIKDI